MGNIITNSEVKVGTNLQVSDNIQHIGDTTNEISFATNTQDFRTNNTSRLDISNSGVRLGGANSRVTTILDEDAMGTNSNTALATQQSIKAYADLKLPLAGGTMSGSINLGDNDITNIDSLDTDKFSIAGGTEMTGILDEDAMGSDSNVKLATQQSIKAYADTKLPLAGGTMSGNVNFGDNDITNVDSLDADKFSIAGGTEMTGILDEDAMGSDSNVKLATQQSIKAYADTKLPLAGGTMSGNVNFGDNDITNVDSFDADKFSIAGGTEMTSIKDEDNMASDSNVALATQQSIKAYVDSQVGGSDTLQEVSDNGATTTNALQFGSNLGISGNTFFEGALSGTGAITVLGNITTAGDVTTDNALVRDNIQHVGDTTNEISFASATQDFRTNNSSRIDISNSGVRLGGANSRVTTILDEDAMGTNSATALATQQSIKAYADLKLPLAGGTMSGSINLGDNDITNIDSLDTDKFSIAGGTEMTGILDEDAMGSDSNVKLATQQSIKAYADTKLPLAGGTMTGNVNFGDNDITNVDSFDADKFSIAGGTEMTSIKDEDNMASDSNVALATQQSIKAYADLKLPLAGGTMTGQLLLNGGSSSATPTPQLKFGNYVDNSGGPSVSHIDLYNGQYGFGVTSADLDYVTGRNHKFFKTGDSTAAMTINPDTFYTGVVGIQTETPKTALDVHHDPTNLANNTGGGEVVTFGTASGSLTAGKLYYLNTSGVWTLTRANASSSNGNGQLLGIALGTAVSSGILLRGFFDMTSYFTGTFNEGIPLYVCETTSGNVNVAAPGATNEFVRVVGYCTNTANTIYFNPDGTYITVA